MDRQELILAIDQEIARLESARALLLEAGAGQGRSGGRQVEFAFGANAEPKKRRRLSAASRAKMAAAQKARWVKARGAKARGK